MRITAVEYHAPDTLESAVATLGRHGREARLLAGGTDLVPALKLGLGGVRHLVSLKRVPGLRGIDATPHGEVIIGALAPLSDVAASPLVRARCPALAEAAAAAGSPLLRNRATLGGNLCLDTRCWYYNQSEAWRRSRAVCQKAGGERCHVNERENRCVALFSADTPPVLLAVAAQVAIAGPGGARSVPVEALYTGEGRRPLALADDEILTAITVPAPPLRSGTAYVKWSVRSSIDFPVLGAAAVVERAGGTIANARVALTGARSAPFRLLEVESAVRGQPVPPPGDEGVARLVTRALGPLFLSDAVPHKRRLAGLVTVEALVRAARAAEGRSA